MVNHFKERDLDILFLQETFLKTKDEAKIKELQEHGINFMSSPRTSGRERGGLAVIYKPSLKLKLNKKTESYQTIEHMELTLQTEEELLRFVNVYRPPYSKKHKYTELSFLMEFEEFAENLVTQPGVPIMAGDFNMHVEKADDRYASQFKLLLEGVNLYQHVPMNPTHRSGGTLDLIITPEDIREKVKDIQIFDHGTDSDHFLVESTVSFSPVHEVVYKTLQYRKYSNIDVDRFRADLQMTGVNTLPTETPYITPEEALQTLNGTMTILMDKHCPVIKRKVKNNAKESTWFDEELRVIKRKKRKCERDWCASRDPEDKKIFKLQYNAARVEMDKMMKLKRVAYHSQSLKSCKDDSKKLWKKINNLLGKPNEKLPEYDNAKAMADTFKDFFSKKVEDIRKGIEDDLEQTHQPLPPLEASKPSYNGKKFERFQTLSEEELYATMNKMSKKFCSLDPVPVWLLLECFEDIKSVLLFIVNGSLTSGIFPESCKMAVVRPTIKNHNGDTDDTKEYRPVSNLSFISKLIERIVADQTNSHLEEEALHCPVQSGYRKHHSCETLMTKMFDDIITEIEEKKTVALILLDLSAAFDTIDHAILLKKLQTDYGFNGVVLSWFKSYLSNRSFSVLIEYQLSESGFLWFGVPQGSILGPLLFILYTKYLSQIAKRHGLEIQLYADDSQLYFGFRPLQDELQTKDLTVRIENCLSDIRDWMRTNFMKLNSEKTKIVLLGTKDLLRKSGSFQIDVGDEKSLSSSDGSKGVKSLGVRIDENLNMRQQIAQVRQSSFYAISNLGRLKNILSVDVRLMLIKQLILSKVDYHNALYVNLPACDVKRLQSVVNAAVRFVYGAGKRVPARQLLIQAHILPVRYRIRYKICLMTFKALNGLAPGYLSDLIKMYTPSRGNTTAVVPSDGSVPRRTNDTLLLHQPPYNYRKSVLSKRSFTYAAPECWNELPYEVRCCEKLDTFKTKLKTFFFSMFINDPYEVV